LPYIAVSIMYAKNVTGNRFYKQCISVDIFSQQKLTAFLFSGLLGFTAASERVGALWLSDTVQ
jgi:hypothetical protein